MKLLIYNPDTDYALASGSDFYTPPASVKKLMNLNPYMAAAWGNPGDAIFMFDWVDGVPDSIAKKYLIVREHNLAMWGEAEWDKVDGIEPWGWNSALRHRLESAGTPCRLLPSKEIIVKLRELSHRRLTVRFNEELGITETPTEIFSEEEGVSYWNANPKCWFKAPWSSSGRGIINTEELEERHIRPWIRGIVRRQGSVMAEKGIEKKHDFATEWVVEKGVVRFLGFSYFRVSGRGKYAGNLITGQDEIMTLLNRDTHQDITETVCKQQKAISHLIAPYYEGPLGIDMMITKGGLIVPCVEINMRRTMGHVALAR